MAKDKYLKQKHQQSETQNDDEIYLYECWVDKGSMEESRHKYKHKHVQ